MSIFEFEEKVYTYDEVVARGHRMQQMLDSDLMKEAFMVAEKLFGQEWLDAKEPAVREAMWAKMHALYGLKSAMLAIINDGESAQHVLKHRAELEALKQHKGD